MHLRKSMDPRQLRRVKLDQSINQPMSVLRFTTNMDVVPKSCVRVIPFLNIPEFLATVRIETMFKWKKILVTTIFSFSTYIFYLFEHESHFLIHNPFNPFNCRQKLRIWTRGKIVVSK